MIKARGPGPRFPASDGSATKFKPKWLAIHGSTIFRSVAGVGVTIEMWPVEIPDSERLVIND